MHNFSAKPVVTVAFLFFGCSALASDSSGMPRDAAVATLVASYSSGACTRRLEDALKITESECVSRSENAKKTCPSLIAAGLPNRLDQKQVSMLVARAMGCHSKMIFGQPYENATWDRSAETMLKEKDGG